MNSPSEETRILLASDCDGLDRTITDLRRQGFRTDVARTGQEALRRRVDHEIMMIDLDITDVDGLALCREIRETSDILLISFASWEADRILALEAGCDDCLMKPYHNRELAARLTTLLRRFRALPPSTLTVGRLRICPLSRQVRVDGNLVEITRKEFELIHLLATDPEKLFSRTELLQRVWGYENVDPQVTSLASRTIDTHVSSLRRKLGSAHWIVTVRGVGFRLSDDVLLTEPPAVEADGCTDRPTG